MNLKQAWRIPSATAIPNPNGTAPGWWVDRPDGRVAVLLPGPPREMRAMWSDWVLPRLRERGMGDGRVVRTLRTYGIGESQVAELLGDVMLRRANPVVATYARADWLDVRVTAVDEPADGAAGIPPVADDAAPARSAETILDETVATLRDTLGGPRLGRGRDDRGRTSSAAAADRAGVRLAVVEAGTTGTLGALLAEVSGARARDVGRARRRTRPGRVAGRGRCGRGGPRAPGSRSGSPSWRGRSRGRGRASASRSSLPGADVSRVLDLHLFQHSAHGRFRAAVAAAAFTIEVLRTLEPAAPGR